MKSENISGNQLYHVTHCDADALGCALVARTPNVVFCDYQNVDGNVLEMLKILRENGSSELLISDIAPTTEVIEAIDQFNKLQNYPRVYLLDHHRTTAHLSKFPWVFHGNDAGAKLLLEAIRACKIPFLSHGFRHASDFSHQTESFVDAVDAYDTWKKESPHFPRGSNISKLQKFLGIEKAFKIFSQNLFFDLGETGRFVLDTLDEKEQREIDKATKKTYETKKDSNEKIFAVLDPCSPIVAHRVLEHLGFDYVVVPNVIFNTVSLYANGKSDVSEIAKKFGGGGHAGASGFTFHLREFVEKIVASKIRGELEPVVSKRENST